MAAPFIQVLSAPGSIPFFGIPFPSGQITAGQPGSNLTAFLVGMRATFGFNENPHTFELDFIPSGQGYGHGASGNLPAVNTELEMTISGFYLKGFVTHANWDSGENGTLLNVIVRDKRNTLDQYKVTTDDLGDNVTSGVCSISREYRLQYGLTEWVTRTWDARGVTKTELEADDSRYLEYQKIIERGATYEQIRNAIERTFGSGIVAKLPTVAEIQANIGQDISSLRWVFGLDTLRDVMSQVTLDTAFDWYWNMSQETIDLINKKTPFSIPESRILSIINGYGGSGIENVTNIGYGTDKLTEPTRVHVLGGYQEGFMNSPLLSPIDGLETIYDGLTSGSGVLLFEGAWQTLTVGFYDSAGYYRTYVPTEKELQMALAGIEQWTYFKKYQTTASPSGWALPSDAGHIAAQHDDFQSRLDPRQPISELLSNPAQNIRVISNRRDLNSNWVIEWYNRVAQHAERHYGKSYIATHALVRDNIVFSLMDSAWCNVENQRQTPSLPFTDGYEINRTYGKVSPFYSPSDGRVSAFCVLPSGTVYGRLGEDSPASFISWTEDAPPFNPSGTGEHYIPVQLATVGERVIDPRNNDAFSFEDYPEQTIWCQLPTLAGSGIIQDDVLGSLTTLTQIGLDLEQSGIIDLIDPRDIVVPYTYLSGVAIPVRSNVRYGVFYPTVWASGNPDPIIGSKIVIDDNLSPWVEFPEGIQTSLDKLNTRAFDRINAEISIQVDSQYVEVGQVGLPKISFDTFANQTANASGYYGEREHGVNEVSIYYGTGGLTTTYKAQSYYETAKKPGPLSERTKSRLEGIIQPIDFTDLGDFLTTLGLGDPQIQQTPLGGGSTSQLNFDFERQEACEVTAVNLVFDEDAVDDLIAGRYVAPEERYYCVVTRNRQFSYVETGATIPNGISQWGHTLNSLDVSVLVAPDDNTVDRSKILATELDQHTIVIDNQNDTFTGTIMISNREGVIRPTQETIRNSGGDVTDDGAACQDGYLNYGDACVYFHRRVDGEEVAYLTGGRKLSPGMIIQVETARDGGMYDVSIVGDRHGRWIAGISSLNSVSIAIGTRAQISENGTSTVFKPGPTASGYTIIPPAAGGGTPVYIEALTSGGTSGAYATVKELDSNWLTGTESYSGVYILPYPQFAEVGDRGMMTTYNPTGSANTNVRYIQLSKSAFLKY
jgi:hypothetical protein